MSQSRNIVLSVITRVVVCVALLAVAVMVAGRLIETRPDAALAIHEKLVPRVVVMRAQTVAVTRQWEGFGTAGAMFQADIPARVTATVTEIPPGVDSGMQVSAGDVIARLDDDDFQRQVEISTQVIADLDAQLHRLAIEEASWSERVKLVAEEVELARAEFARVEDAAQRGAARQREIDLARQALIQIIRAEVTTREEFDKLPPRKLSLEAQKAAQQSQLRLAQQNLQRCTIVAPIDGVLDAVDVEVGENVIAGSRIARVVNLSRIEIPVRLPAGARRSLAVGDDVQIHSTGASAQSWPAKVTRISPEDDPATRTVTAYVEVLQESTLGESTLAPGRFVRATVRSGEPAPRSVVPRRSLVDDRILLVRDGRIESRAVEVDFSIEATFAQLGVPDRHWVVLRDSLAPDEQIVLTAAKSLTEGSAAQGVPAEQWYNGGEQIMHEGAP